MEVGSQEWIEHSLAKLEELEQERDHHEQALETAVDADRLRVHSEAIESLDEEIKALYAQLETVAEDEETAEDPDEAAATNEFQRDEATAEASPAETSAVEAAGADDDALPDNPFGTPASAPPLASGFGESSGFGDPGGGGFGTDDGAYDFDPPKSGGAAKWVILGLVVAGGGVGGYLYLNQQKAPEPEPAAPTEVRVIEAKAVPEDTQEPKAAEGADVDRTPGLERDKKRGGGGGGGGGGRRANNKKKDDGTKIKLSDSDDPLG